LAAGNDPADFAARVMMAMIIKNLQKAGTDYDQIQEQAG
jgi:hypothetical protein